MSTTTAAQAAPLAARAQAGQGTSTSVTASGVRDVDALLSGYKWGGTNLTFALPTAAAQYTAYDAALDENNTFSPVAGCNLKVTPSQRVTSLPASSSIGSCPSQANTASRCSMFL